MDADALGWVGLGARGGRDGAIGFSSREGGDEDKGRFTRIAR